MNIKVRKANFEDASSINILSAQLGYPVSLNQTKHNLQVILPKQDEVVFVACIDDTIVGWTYVFLATRLESGVSSEVGGLIVDGEHRDKGIGQLLMEEAIKWGKEMGAPLLRIRTNVIRKDAHRFYKRLGFEEVKEQKILEIKLSGPTAPYSS